MKPAKKYKLNVKRLTVHLPAELDAAIRQCAKVEDRPLSTVAERAFRAYLAMNQTGV